MPLRGYAKTLVQGLAIGVGTALVIKAVRRKTPSTSGTAPVDCSGVGVGAGTVEGITYLETMRGGAKPDDRVPMVVVFHSRGAPPTGAASFPGLKGPARVIRPEGPKTLGNLPSWFTLPSSTADQAAWAADMKQVSDQMAKFLSTMIACRPTIGLPVVTGSSEGGHMAYLMASRYPHLVRGAVAVLGYLPQQHWNRGMAQTVGLHGTQDNTVPYARTAQFWSAMKSQGAKLTTSSFPSGHSVSGGIATAWTSAVNQMLGY